MEQPLKSASARYGPVMSWQRRGDSAQGMTRAARSSFAVGAAPVIVSQAYRTAAAGDAEIQAPSQDSFSLLYMIDHLPAHESWSIEGHVNVPDLPKGSMHIMDLRPGGSARIRSAFNSLNIAIPRSALAALADQIGRLAPRNLHVPQAWTWRDPLVEAIHASIAQAVRMQDEVDDLVFDHLLLALLTHVAVSYGEMLAPSTALQGSLSALQLARAEAAIVESLEIAIPLAEIARRCDLSPSHFSRAFKQATGRSPSAWRLERRIELAQRLLREDRYSIAEVAALSGFADQSHLTRTFSRQVGQTPGDFLMRRRSRK